MKRHLEGCGLQLVASEDPLWALEENKRPVVNAERQLKKKKSLVCT